MISSAARQSSWPASENCLHRPSVPPTAQPTMFTIQGRTYSHDGVARLLSRLQVVPDLTNVQLQSSTLAKVGGQDVVEFSIAADIKVAGAPGS